MLNKKLLEKLNKSNSWRHYKKIKPVWARRLKKSETVITLEGKITYNAGNFLCKGPSGDIWGQKEITFLDKYESAPKSKPDTEGWLKFLPKRDAKGVMAASINHDFTVEHPVWGTFHGGKGDFLVKNFKDKEIKFPKDIWIVKQKIFKVTYSRV